MAYIGKSPSGLGVRTRYYYTATGGETSLSGADDNGRVLKFTDGEYIDVYLNGVLLVAGTDYGTGTANTISSLDALSAGNIVEIVAYDIHSLAKPNLEALRKRYYKTATGGETSISGNDDDGQAITFAANAEIEVYLNGVALVQGDDYNTTTANTVGGLAALDADDIVSIVAYEEFTLGDVVSKKSGGTFAGDVTFSQDVTVGGTLTASGNVDVTGNELILDADGDTSITADTDDQIDFKTGGTDAMHIDASQNVGIGTSAPSALAHIYNGTLQVGSKTGDTSIQQNANAIRISAIPNSSTEWGGLQWYREFSDVIGAEIIASRGSSAENQTDLIFKTSTNSSDAVEGMRIYYNGRIAVTRHSSDTSVGGYSIEFITSAPSTSRVRHINFVNSGQGRGYIQSGDSDSSVPRFLAGSDYRFKTNITDYTGGYDKIKSIPVKQFDETTTGKTGCVGWIAHEVAEHFPDAVEGEKDAVDDDGNPIYQSLASSAFYPDVVQALQKTIEKLEAAEAKIVTLETENATQATTIADFETRIAALEAN